MSTQHPSNGRPENEGPDAQNGRVRYAVVGLGHIAQAAVLPAFRHARENSELKALVSGDPTKLSKLGRRHKVGLRFSYDQYDECLKSGEIDAVYIALPNHMHCDYACRAAAAGVHMLCEKPMAVTEAECRQMIEAAAASSVRLMIAYRLHFEAANLKAVEIVQGGVLGKPRFFTSSFSMQVKDENIRLRREMGGGPLYDIGIYCINAARYLFRDEPWEVFCTTVNGGDPRFDEVEEMASVVMRFPQERLATFTCSYGAADVSAYRVVGTEGELVVDPAYEYYGKLAHRLTVAGKMRKQVFPKRDQFAPELIHFSQCVLEGRDPVSSGWTGLADVRIIEALYRSAAEGRVISLEAVSVPEHPSDEHEIHRPAVPKEPLVHAESASQ